VGVEEEKLLVGRQRPFLGLACSLTRVTSVAHRSEIAKAQLIRHLRSLRNVFLGRRLELFEALFQQLRALSDLGLLGNLSVRDKNWNDERNGERAW